MSDIEFKLSDEDQADFDQYYVERDMIRENFEGYIELKKEVVKANYFKARQNLEARKNIKDVRVLDFNYMFGDTIKDKYESLMLESIQIGREVKHNFSNKMCDVNWICGSPELTAIFETATLGFEPTGYEYEQGLAYVGSMRVFDHVWHILKNSYTIEPLSVGSDQNVGIDPSRFYVGCGDHCFKVIFDNFII